MADNLAALYDECTPDSSDDDGVVDDLTMFYVGQKGLMLETDEFDVDSGSGEISLHPENYIMRSLLFRDRTNISRISFAMWVYIPMLRENEPNRSVYLLRKGVKSQIGRYNIEIMLGEERSSGTDHAHRQLFSRVYDDTGRKVTHSYGESIAVEKWVYFAVGKTITHYTGEEDSGHFCGGSSNRIMFSEHPLAKIQDIIDNEDPEDDDYFDFSEQHHDEADREDNEATGFGAFGEVYGFEEDSDGNTYSRTLMHIDIGHRNRVESRRSSLIVPDCDDNSFPINFMSDGTLEIIVGDKDSRVRYKHVSFSAGNKIEHPDKHGEGFARQLGVIPPLEDNNTSKCGDNTYSFSGVKDGIYDRVSFDVEVPVFPIGASKIGEL